MKGKPEENVGWGSNLRAQFGHRAWVVLQTGEEGEDNMRG